MTYLITNKETNEVMRWGDKLDYLSNGYPRLIDENVAFVANMVNVHEVESVPVEVSSLKYCYTEEQGFYENPNYVEPNPYGIPDELLQQIQDDTAAQIVQEVAEEGIAWE